MDKFCIYLKKIIKILNLKEIVIIIKFVNTFISFLKLYFLFL